LFEQAPILLGVEVFSHPVFALDRQHVTTEFPWLTPSSRFCGDFDDISPRLLRGPFGLVQSRSVLRGHQIRQRIRSVGPDDVGRYLGVYRSLELLVSHLCPQLDPSFVHEQALGGGSDHRPRRLRDQPAQKLLPEKVVRRIAKGFAHLPTPGATRRQNGRAAVAEALCDQQGQFAAARMEIRKHGGAGLRCTGILIIGEKGQFFPALGVLPRIIEQLGNGRVQTLRCQLNGCSVTVEVVISRGKKGRQHVVQGRRAPASIAQRKAAAEEQDAAASAIDILAQQFLLQGREITRVDRANDDARITEEILRPHRKATR